MPYKKAINHLKKDEILKPILENHTIKPSLQVDIYFELLESIVSQQLSVKVAKIIFNRFLDLFVDRYPTAKQLVLLDDEILRNVGLSYRKASYLKNVAAFSIKNKMDYEFLHLKTDEEIIEYLIVIKGVGKWTVQMILMFSMDRQDVFPIDDLGIQNNMKNLYNLTSEKKELKKELLLISENWKPFRTIACKYIWKFGDS